MEKTKKTSVSTEFAGRTLTFETGQLARQATAAVLARYGDTMVLATVVVGRVREDLGYFPLSVEYGERLYAGGKIKGSRWVKREGRPSDDAVLTGRLIDRSIRPLFPKDYKNEVQVIVTVLSVDGENEPDILAINAVSAALAMSKAPWNGPVGAIRMGLIQDPANGDAAILHNPLVSESEHSVLDLVVSQTGDNKTLMIESGANQVNEELMGEAIIAAHTETQKVISFINGFVKKVGQKKDTVEKNPVVVEMISAIKKSYTAEAEKLVAILADKEAGSDETGKLIDTIYENQKAANPDAEVDKKAIAQALEYVMYQIIRTNVVTKEKRVDGRKVDELRELGAEVGILPRTHGSAVFQRGLTQALTITTLGSPRLEQLIESAEGEESKRYMHHYAMPPYSVGEAGRVGSPSRREIGHGALAERALEPVIPSRDKFPYTIRVVSEILSSNGSTSMASVCGSTLSLMDAGVPIESPVGGISIGMMSIEDKYVLLTDIIGLEDFSGDMDFKVAGTDKGITAIQLDVKIPGLTDQQVKETLARAKTARTQILAKITSTLEHSREKLSEYAPKIEQIQVPVDKIGEVIGPGGRVIKNIIATTGATVDVEDDGRVTITGTTDESVQAALNTVQGITREIQVGELFEGPVKRILPFGAFVELLPGKEGMVHVSHMAEGFVKSPEDVVQLDQPVKVKVIEIDDQGRINLTMRLDEEPGSTRRPEGSGPRPERRGGFGGGDRRPSFGNRDRGPRRDDRRESRDTRESAPPAGDDHPLSRQFRRERSEQRIQSKKPGYRR